MKKTLTVNLGGTVYHIDEDAYILLDNYLNNLRYHFRKDEGAEEIVRDIESRIAELFDEALRGGLQVITIKEVEEVIARMGKPEELNGEEDGNPSASNSKTFDSESTETRRRLFRNPDDRITGDKTKCERTKCECEASVTANQRVTKHKQHERQKTKCSQNIHGANNSAYITTGGMGVFLTRAAFSVSHGCNGMNRGKNA